jgi:4a-hydroxytetrahydrobiopterin dehydratase
MAPRGRLSDSEIQTALQDLPEWTVKEGKLHREYQFPDFTHAFGFMATAATTIQAMDHHPEWFNVYGRVIVDLTTHDAGGISSRDVELARKLDQYARKLQ